MEIQVRVLVSKKELPRDYRPVIVSMFKALLNKYYPEEYQRLYLSGSVQKDFTFAVRFDKPVFSEGSISFSNEKILLSVSSANEYYAMLFYNAFKKGAGYAHPLANGGTMSVAQVIIVPQPRIMSDCVLAKFISPLVVRRHDRDSGDRYFIYDDEEFEKCLKTVVEGQIGRPVEFHIKPVKSKKTVVQSFGTSIRCSLGTFKISAPPEVIDILSKSGIGSRRGEGYGFFKVLGG